MFSAMSPTTPHLLNMTWQNDDFLLADCVKLFYTISASPLNYLNKYFQPNNINTAL
jgi:hypothetical protein